MMPTVEAIAKYWQLILCEKVITKPAFIAFGVLSSTYSAAEARPDGSMKFAGLARA